MSNDNSVINRRQLLKSSLATLGASSYLLSSNTPASAAKSSASKIDIHAHYFPTEYLDRLDRYGSKVTATARRLSVSNEEPQHLDARFKMMDRGGIAMQVISCSNVVPYFDSEANSVEGARLANDLYAGLIRKYPGKFAAFGCPPLPHIDASLKEMARALDDLHMSGITVATFVMGKSIADPMFEPLFAELNRRKAVVFIHPTGGGGGSQWLDSTKLVWPIGAPLEDALILMQFVQQDYPRKFPDMKVIIPHLGGFAPFLMTRFDQFRDQYMEKSLAAPSSQSKYFWFDTVNGNPSALRCACDTLDTGKIMLGTDFPYWADDALQEEVEYVKQPAIAPHVEEAIYTANARRLLGLKT